MAGGHICHDTHIVPDWTIVFESLNFVPAGRVTVTNILSMTTGGQSVHREGVTLFMLSIEARMVFQEILELVAVTVQAGLLAKTGWIEEWE
jgi:hypothetical protein